MSERRPRVLLADDHPLMLEGLRRLLSQDFEVVGAATDGRALLEAAEIRRPDLIITDISMPSIDGIEATRQLRDIVPEARVMILSIHNEPSWVRAAFDAGAYGYLTKSSAPEEIESAVHQVLQGNFYVSPAVTRAVVAVAKEDTVHRTEARPAAAGALSPRQVEIVRLVGQGLGNKEIAHALQVSVTTVRTHLNKVHEKIGTASRVELALYAAHSDEAVM